MTGYFVGQGKRFTEFHSSHRDAYRAYLILLAHERRNNRSGDDLFIKPPVKCFLDEIPYGLPSWAEEALGEEFLKSITR